MKNCLRIFSIALLCSFGLSSLQAKALSQRSEKKVEKRKVEKKCVVDYVIVGSGPGGSVPARMLSDNFCNSVILLERGDNFMNDPQVSACDLAHLDALFNQPQLTRTFLAQDPNLGTILVGNGMTLGGSGTHNFLLSVWADQTFDAWRDASGDNRWLRANVIPLFKANETYLPFTPPASPLRGTNGPIVTSQLPPIDNLTIAKNIATLTGTTLQNDYNAPDNPGGFVTSTGQLLCNLQTGQRSFAAKAYLNDVINPDGTSKGKRRLTVKTRAWVTKVLFGGKDGKKAIGVEFINTGSSKNKHKRIFARKAVILSAGSFYTPQLLLLSGIGPKAQLAKFNIPEVQINEHVGRHFKYHYGVEAIFSNGFPDDLPVISFFSATTPKGPIRDSQFIVNPTLPPLSSLFLSRCLSSQANGEPAGTVTAWNIAPRSEGTVELADTNPLIDPLVNFNTFSDGTPMDPHGINDPNSDAGKAITYFKLTKAIAESIGAEIIFPNPNDFVGTPAEVNQKLFEDALISPSITNHYMGTCRMAKTDQGPDGGVVDGRLRVFGVRNLIISDLSITPTANKPISAVPAGNTSTPTAIIGIVAAQSLGATAIP